MHSIIAKVNINTENLPPPTSLFFHYQTVFSTGWGSSMAWPDVGVEKERALPTLAKTMPILVDWIICDYSLLASTSCSYFCTSAM